jgi:hypothetical protein
MTQLVRSKIELEIDNMPQEEAEILKSYFILMIGAGIHKCRNGKIILYFDNNGLAQIGSNNLLWKRGKDS